MTPTFYVVGGAVRDMLLGCKPNDMDFVVVGASPEWMLDNGYSKVGADFPVFLKDGDEYALARTERKTGTGYKGFETHWAADVTLEDDLVRRDLTINSLAVLRDSWPHFVAACEQAKTTAEMQAVAREFVEGSVDDLFNYLIRANSAAFSEDPLRVLRAARFVATMPRSGRKVWSIEQGTVNSMCDMVVSDDFQHLTAERVVQEVLKTAEKCKSYDHFVHYLITLDAIGAMPTIFTEFGSLNELHSNSDTDFDSVTAEEAVGMLMMTRRGHSETALKALKTMKYPNDTVSFASTLYHLLDRAVYADPQTVSGDLLVDIMASISHNQFKAVMRFLTLYGLINPSQPTYQKLEYAQRVWKETGIKDLTEDQRESLSGKAIGLAIWGVKLKLVNNFVAKLDG